jgi:hypothetical protein
MNDGTPLGGESTIRLHGCSTDRPHHQNKNNGGYLKGRVYSPIRNNQVAPDRASAVAKFPGKDFPKYEAPGSILSGRKLWPLAAHVMMSSHLLHNQVSPVQISLQYSH